MEEMRIFRVRTKVKRYSKLIFFCDQNCETTDARIRLTASGGFVSEAEGRVEPT